MRPVLLKVGCASNTLILGLDLNDDVGICLSDFLDQIHNDARTIAELWHELGDTPGALEPILEYALDEYLAFERYELKKN